MGLAGINGLMVAHGFTIEQARTSATIRQQDDRGRVGAKHHMTTPTCSPMALSAAASSMPPHRR